MNAYYALKPIPTDDSSRRLPRIGETPAEGRGSAGGMIPTSNGSVGSEKPAPPPHEGREMEHACARSRAARA